MSRMVFPYDEVPRYRKRSGKKVGSKAGHKHKYSECLICDTTNISHREYCTVCGRLKSVDGFQFELDENRVMLTNQQIREKYADLPMFSVANIVTAKYVSNVEDNKE